MNNSIYRVFADGKYIMAVFAESPEMACFKMNMQCEYDRSVKLTAEKV